MTTSSTSLETAYLVLSSLSSWWNFQHNSKSSPNIFSHSLSTSLCSVLRVWFDLQLVGVKSAGIRTSSCLWDSKVPGKISQPANSRHWALCVHLTSLGTAALFDSPSQGGIGMPHAKNCSPCCNVVCSVVPCLASLALVKVMANGATSVLIKYPVHLRGHTWCGHWCHHAAGRGAVMRAGMQLW